MSIKQFLNEPIVLFAIVVLIALVLSNTVKRFNQTPEGEFWKSGKDRGRSVKKSELI